MERPPMNQLHVEQKQAEIQRPTESFADARARLQQIVDRLQQESNAEQRAQILQELQRERQPLIERAVLVCPRNDMEAETIFRLAEKLGLVTIASDQGHGAALDKEPGIVEALKHTTKPDVFIVEIPSIETEGNIANNNQEVHIIDHHQYGEVLDRRQDASSLDQFRAHFAITDDELMEMGYDPMVVRGIGIMDHSFVKGLKAVDYTLGDINKIIDFIVQWNVEKDPDYEERDAVAEVEWNSRRTEKVGDREIIITESPAEEYDGSGFHSFRSIREGVDEELRIISVMNGLKIYVYNVGSDVARQLVTALIPRMAKETLAFTFGKDRCMGVDNTGLELTGRVTINDVLHTLRSI